MTKESARRRPSPVRTLYRAFDFVVLRAPLLPVESYLALEQAEAEGRAAGSLAPTDSQVRRALAIGSPTLLESLDRTAPDDPKASGLRMKLRRFLVRMSTRPTPYGTFAGVALGRWSSQTDLCLATAPRTRTRADMDWLVRYVLALDAQPAVRTQLRWVANSATWIDHGRVSKGPTAGVTIAATPVARRALTLARVPIAYPDLVRQLVESVPSATAAKVEALLAQLWECGFLRTDLMPPATVEDPVAWLRHRVASITGGKALCVQLDALEATIASCDAVDVGEAPKALRRAAAHMRLLGQTETPLPLQIDMALGVGGAHLSTAVADEAARTADLLIRLAPNYGASQSLDGYRNAFLARYGTDREVALTELLHPEWGLGPTTQYAPSGKKEATRSSKRADALQYLAQRAIREGQRVVDLDDRLLDRLSASPPKSLRLPPSIDLNLFLMAGSPAAVDAGAFQLLVGPNVGAMGAGRSLGRFASLLGPAARLALERAARHDETHHPGHIAAELAYMPRAFRSANVTLRPAVRRYEIVHGVNAGVDPDHVIPLNELVVGTRDERFYVRWLRVDQNVVVSSGHMLNVTQSPAEYQLLSQISQDGVLQLTGLNWGPASNYAYLPRVQSGRVILSCAHWRLDVSSSEETAIDKPQAFADWFARWRERWLVPRRVYLSWTDNRLLFDLDDPAQVEDLRGEVARSRSRGHCVLEEALPGPEHAWLASPDGKRHIVELAVSLGLTAPPPSPNARDRRAAPAVTADVRLRPPGSDWLYLKLYGAKSEEDDLLANDVARLCRDATDAGLMSSCFFLRYADPERHLRLRFRPVQGRVDALFLMVSAWASRLVASGRSPKFAFDTYEREVERYGGAEAMAVAEDVFAADSAGALELLALARLLDRQALAVVAIDDLLSSLGLAHAGARLAWLRSAVDSRKEVADEYRAKREKLVAALQQPSSLSLGVAAALARRHAAVQPLSHHLASLSEAGALTRPLPKLYESYVHMLCNRLGVDPAGERRALGLLMRAREAIEHRPKVSDDDTRVRRLEPVPA